MRCILWLLVIVEVQLKALLRRVGRRDAVHHLLAGAGGLGIWVPHLAATAGRVGSVEPELNHGWDGPDTRMALP